ncbi:mitogen-activated protein kinase kinase kinase 18-like [Nicotiana sylvestris]|uniref:mitogen-activated protein kinase kinase kinase n=1 Tax=Nicotiana sylvestris TaxID=4096 RepID=A0A1U7XWA5_NICSY|nr:PREDICTED: mitogen-activated protein kinase kinase kinase A-like [Nicotiana sylvestris]
MDWTRGHIIGHGSSAAVSVAKSRWSSEIFAVKSVELSQSQFLQKEQKVLSALSSPYIVSYKGYDVTKENNTVMFNLMMEYMSEGTIADEIRKNGGRINEPVIGYYTKQILLGLEYLHSRGVVHCDIKGQNILLGKTGAKIADFGCARWVDTAERDGGASAQPIGGTPMYMAPEVARGEEQGFAADIWGLGCTIIEMATGGSPWTNVTNSASLLYKIAFSGQSPEIPKFLSLQAKDFLSKCFRRDQKERWTAKQLLKHPFLEEISNFKEIQDSITSSPTSILDQDIWNSVEETETMDSTTIQLETSIDSPLQRVRKLGLNSRKPNWRWDDEIWTTVRLNSKQNEGDDDLEVCGTVTAFSGSREIELESCFGSDESEISCLDNIFCCNIQKSSVVRSLNFTRHFTSSVNKIQCS